MKRQKRMQPRPLGLPVRRAAPPRRATPYMYTHAREAAGPFALFSLSRPPVAFPERAAFGEGGRYKKQRLPRKQIWGSLHSYVSIRRERSLCGAARRTGPGFISQGALWFPCPRPRCRCRSAPLSSRRGRDTAGRPRTNTHALRFPRGRWQCGWPPAS